MRRRPYYQPRPCHRPRLTGTATIPTKLSDEEIKTIEKLPQVLAIQKKKFLTAINETKGVVGGVSAEEEQLVTEVTDSLGKQVYSSDIYYRNQMTKPWNDSGTVKWMLQEHATFDLKKYLNCAEYVCYKFATKQCFNCSIGSRADYLLTHARQFGDPTKTIFQVEALVNPMKKTCSLITIPQTTLKPSQSTTIVKRTKQLIAELKEEYDETKYRALNAQVTSFALILLRRLMKQPHYDIRSNSQSLNIIIEAYLTTDDAKTKKNIRETCEKHMEWFDMQLPCLFFKVVELYSIDAGDLWDLLCSVKSRKTNISLIYLASEYYDKYQMSKTNPAKTQNWFPYCRLFDNDYHKKLSNKANVCICAILGSLIEKKNNLDEPAFKYTCPDNDNVNEWATKIAAELFSKINK